MKKCSIIQLLAILLVLFGIGFWITEKLKKDPYDKYTKTIERLGIQNDSLLQLSAHLDQKTKQLYLLNDSLGQILHKKRIEIKHLKKEKHEKIKAIDHYSNDKLLCFFARIKTDSIRGKP